MAPGTPSEQYLVDHFNDHRSSLRCDRGTLLLIEDGFNVQHGKTS
jgi:hypothetical protein